MVGEVKGQTCTTQRPRRARMASWLDTDWLWMPKLCLRLLPAQQPEIGGVLERRTQRSTFCLSCSPG